jgi:betaine-aldehyde dehydrogenase
MPSSANWELIMTASVKQDTAISIAIEDIQLGHCYIDGRWQPIADPEGEQELYNPATGAVIAKAPLGSARDVDKAVFAAAQAALPWRQTPPAVRSELLERIAAGLASRRQALIELSMLNNGKIRAEAVIDVDDAIAAYRHYAEVAQNLETKEALGPADTDHQLYRCHEPVGVSALIVPWNFPMVTTSWKVAPALAAGFSVVLKPSEFTLLPELVLGDIAAEAGLPAGVLNIVPGGASVGQAMVDDPRVRKVSFTGSNAIGEQVMRNAAAYMHKISLELGGKSPIVVFEDVDLDWAVEQVMGGIFFNAGQMCSATSRLIVAESIAEDFYARLKAAAEALHVGPSDDAQSDMGPLVSRKQLERVQKYLAIASQENLHCLTGGRALASTGFFVAPTVYTDVSAASRLWREEIFGPVLVTTRFAEEAQAVRLANDTDFGLAATVLSRDTARGWRVMEAINAGAQWLNDYQLVVPAGGWGGYKQSGIGRELGSEGLHAYQETKYIVVPNDAVS